MHTQAATERDRRQRRLPHSGAEARSVRWHRFFPGRRVGAASVALTAIFTLFAAVPPLPADASPNRITWLRAVDFTYGTYIIEKPGVYRLAEDISFNPNSPATLTAAMKSGELPRSAAAALGLPYPVDAYHAGMPLFTQFLLGEDAPFTPGGPLDARYDPAAYGVGFFAAIAVQADGVVIDLNGHTIEQSEEHALLQRFFAVFELADQPFLPAQGPASFGSAISAAKNVVIENGTIGRSSHHGVHGNANENITIRNVAFDGYEVGAVALNGVKDLSVRNVKATNRKDVPVLGTFSSAMFIKNYVDDLVRSGSATTLAVNGAVMTATDIQGDLRDAINNTHHDIIVTRHMAGGRAVIDAVAHSTEYGLFHNPHGVVDGNSYSFLVNHLGVAVDGFPGVPDGLSRVASESIRFHNVRVVNQHAFINEIPAIDTNGSSPGGTATIDPVGAVLQIRNVHPDTGEPVTISSLVSGVARYTGNPVANAQAFVAKANEAGDVGSGRLDITRLNIPASVVGWVEGRPGFETLEAIGTTYLCNGDSMFHVNKGAIAFKMDAASDVHLTKTRVDGLVNLGRPGMGICGDYTNDASHPAATLHGYGGSAVRAYTFAGSERVLVNRAKVKDLSSMSGPAIGFAVLTDSNDVRIMRARVNGISAGWGDGMPSGTPNNAAYAAGFYVGDEAADTLIVRGCSRNMSGYDGVYFLRDESADTKVRATCRANR